MLSRRRMLDQVLAWQLSLGCQMGVKPALGEDYPVPAAFFPLEIPAWSRSQSTSFAGQDRTGQE